MLDFKASVESVVENVSNIKYKKYLYISTCQVYENLRLKKLTLENVITDKKKLNKYGFNKLIAEQYVKKYSKKYLIVRLPYVIGPNLKRNPFFDILKKKRSFLTLNSKINCIHTDSIAEICMKLINKKIYGTFNIGSNNTMSIYDILNLLNLKKFFKKNNRTKDINNINFEKIKKIIKLPDIFEEAKKYFKNESIKKNNLL